MPDETLPEIWVRAHPFGDANSKDAHGEFFDAETEFYDDLLPAVPVNYYHAFTPEGKPSDKPIAIGIAAERQYKNPLTGEADGRWDKIKFFDNVSLDIKTRIQNAIEAGTLRSSPSTVPDYHRVRDDGKITHWLSGNLAVFDASGNRQPANPRAIGIAEMKALYKAAHLEFPNSLMKGGGNPNHDAEGKFSSGGAKGKDQSPTKEASQMTRDEFKNLALGNGQSLIGMKGVWNDPSGRWGKLQSRIVSIEPGVSSGGTQGVWLRLGNDAGQVKVNPETFHKAQIEQSLSEGKSVPAEVLADYPDLEQTSNSNKQKARLEGVSMAQAKQNWMKQFVNTLKALFETMPQTAEADADTQENMAQWDEIFGKDETVETESPKAEAPTQEEPAMADEKQLQELRETYDNQMKAMLANNSKIQRELDETKLAAWFDEQLRAGKVMPAEKEEIVGMALQLKADDDAAHPTMKSAEGNAITRLDAFKKTIEARPSRLGGDNQLKAAGFDTPQGADAPPSAERVNKLLKMTPLGEQVLKEKNGNGS